MKLVTFALPGGEPRIGALLAGERQVVDLTASGDTAMRSMLALIDGGTQALARARGLLDAARVVHDIASVRLLAALPRPRQMRDFLCFEQHLRQARANSHLFGVEGERDPAKITIPKVWYEQPVYYKCNRFAVIGTGVDVLRPAYCRMLDYELEFAAIVGTGGKNIRREDARGHIFGYLIFNDFSARDAQMREMAAGLGPAKGKDFDGANALGPWLVTADEIPDPYALTMVARVNGQEWSRGSSAAMHHRFEDIIAHVSRDETLHPGEFLGSGTVGGGCGLELGRMLQDGDVVELEIDGLGVLRNRVVFQ